MLAALLLALSGGRDALLPGPAEKRFEARVVAVLGDDGTAALDAGADADLLPALLDRWAVAALLAEPPDEAAIRRVERLCQRTARPIPALVPRRTESLGAWRGAVRGFGEARGTKAWGEVALALEPLGDRRGAALARLHLARAFVKEGAWTEAAAAVSAANAFAEAEADAPLALLCAECEAEVHRDESPDASLRASERALSLARRLEDLRGEGEAERGIAVVRARRARRTPNPEEAESEWRAAIEGFDRAVELAGRAGDEALRARSLRGRGGVHANRRNLDRARADLEAALRFYEAEGNLLEAGAVSAGLFQALETESPDEAFVHLERAANAFGKAGEKSTRTAQLFHLYAIALAGRGVPGEAPPAAVFDALDRAIEANETRSDPNYLAETLNQSARALTRAGRLDEAEARARRSLAICEATGKAGAELGNAHLRLGEIALLRGGFEDARRSTEEALRRFGSDGAGWSRREAHALLGRLHRFLGDPQRAEAELREAVRLAGEASREGGAGALALAALLAESDRPAEAARLLEECAGRARESGEIASEAAALRDLAWLDLEARPAVAIERIVGARRALAEHDAPELRASIDRVEAEARLRLGDFDGACACFRRSLRGGTRTDPAQRAGSSVGLAEAELRRGRLDAAGEAHREATEALAEIRPATMEESWRIGLQERFDRLPAIGVELAVRAGDDAGGLAAAEDAQGRALAEVLERGGSTGKFSLDRLRPRLAESQAFVAFADGLDAVHAFVVRRDGIRRFDLGSRAPIETAARAFRALCEEPKPASSAAVSEFAAAGARLRDLVWAPIAPGLADARGLVVAPGFALAGVPFEALPDGDSSGAVSFADLRYLVRRHAFAYTPSARVLAALCEIPAERGSGLFALGDPAYTPSNAGGLDRLAHSRREVEGVAQLFEERERTVVLGEAAARPALVPGKALDAARIVLLSAHGRADERSASACGIWLAPADLFSVADLSGRALRADLVSLVACRTNRGRRSTGEGVLSLARAFLRAGARSVLASEWLVDDEAGSRLSVAFHEGWIRGGLPPADALRRAKLDHMRGPAIEVASAARDSARPRPKAPADPRHPFFWAPFLLFGPLE